MARVTKVEKARKDIIGSDGKVLVAKGESYYHWTLGFRGRKQISKTYPNKRQLTQSEHRLRIYDFEDSLNGLTANTAEELSEAIECFVGEISEYKDDLEDRLSNMPDHLQESSILNERIEGLDNAINELESMDLDYEEPDEDELEANADNADFSKAHLAEWISERLDEAQSIGFE